MRQKVLSAFRINIEKVTTKKERKTMNRNRLVGLALVASSFVLVAFCAAADGGVATDYVGKAVWYLPYGVLIAGLRKLVRA